MCNYLQLFSRSKAAGGEADLSSARSAGVRMSESICVFTASTCVYGAQSELELLRLSFNLLRQPVLGATQPPVKWISALFPRVKWPGRGVKHEPFFRAEVKERIELYFYSLSGPSWPVLQRTSTLLLPLPLPLNSLKVYVRV
jgi:hypothetical protein